MKNHVVRHSRWIILFFLPSKETECWPESLLTLDTFSSFLHWVQTGHIALANLGLNVLNYLNDEIDSYWNDKNIILGEYFPKLEYIMDISN